MIYRGLPSDETGETHALTAICSCEIDGRMRVEQEIITNRTDEAIMRAVDIIQKKRDGAELTPDELKFFLRGYLAGDIPDYQVSPFLMAVYFNGMSDAELSVLTEVMMHSGELIEFSGVEKFLIDKHSTGGVGDKTTLALAPLFAALDIGTAKLSGRGLGHTGGTIDKFESIPGFTFPASRTELVEIVNVTGIGIMGYSDTIVPLDKKLYALRDVTATVPSIPLIASSIMSKKLAVASDAIILDVKTGSGAFMKSLDDSKLLASTMIAIGRSFGRTISAVVSDMDQPLGCAVGNTLEVIEACETLKGRGPEDFTELVITLGALGLSMKEGIPHDEARARAHEALTGGRAFSHFEDFVAACGGDCDSLSEYSKLPMADHVFELHADTGGFVNAIHAESVGVAAMVLGAGREKKDDLIDHGAGVVLRKKCGDSVEAGEVIAELYYNEKYSASFERAKELLRSAYKIETDRPEKRPLVFEIMR